MKVALLVFLCASATSALGLLNPRSRWFGIQDASDETEIVPQASWDFVDCGHSTDVITIDSFEISPNPPEAGKNLTVTVKASASETIEDGAYVDVTVKVGRIKILSKRLDICQEAQNADAEIQCPVEPGPHSVVQTVLLPKEIPPAKYLVTVRGYTVDKKDMMCADIYVDLRKSRFILF